MGAMLLTHIKAAFGRATVWLKDWKLTPELLPLMHGFHFQLPFLTSTPVIHTDNLISSAVTPLWNGEVFEWGSNIG